MTTNTRTTITGTMSLLSGGTELVVPFHQFLQTITVEHVPGGSWTAEIVLFDKDGDNLERVIIAAGQERNINFQWGWDDPNQDEQRRYEGAILHYLPEFLPHGIALTLQVVSRSVCEAILDRKVRSFQEGMTASEIVEFIANDNGWTTSDEQGRPTIEATDPPLEQPFSSSGESDVKFIRDQMVKQAVSAGTGEGGYLFYFDETNAIHFRTPSFLGPVTHTYRYARDASGEVKRFSPQDNSVFGAMMGGGNSLFSAAASNPGGTAETQTTLSGGVDNEGAPSPIDAAAKLDLGEGVHSYVHLHARDPEETKRLAKVRYDEFRRVAFQANLTVHGTHRVRMSDLVRVEYLKADGTAHYLSGNFQVFKLKHSAGIGQDWETEFEMLRPAIEQLPGTSVITSSQTIDAPDAPGSDSQVSVPVG